MEVVLCPNCHERVQVPEEYFGKNEVCPKCQNAFTAQAVELPVYSTDEIGAGLPPPGPVGKHSKKGLLQKHRLTDDEYGDVDISLPARQPPAPILEGRMVNAGVMGGLALIIVAVAWFVIGLAAGVIFYYPPIMFVIGLMAMLKGAVSRN
ncbi:MAG: zinc-ribbon domain-containing protein, partial [Gemmataceae bacterium]|nr:zinc-ribbon domain-containing protein [Gemmataceae bacterium]